MSVLSNSKLLKNIKRDKKLLKSCYKLDKTLKTAQVYMCKNSKYLDSNISKLNKNLDDDVDDLEAKNMTIELSYHNKLEPTIHMKKIKKQGTTKWRQ